MIRARTLRWHLVQVLLAGILPIGAFAAGLLFLHWQVQEKQRRALQMEATRLLGVALDNALDSTTQRLGILARQWAVRPGDEAQLYEAARSALAGSPDWQAMLVFKASGEAILRTDRPLGTPLPSMRLREYSAAALKENRPTISEIFINETTATAVVGIAHPVSRNGVVTHVLIASLNLRWFDDLLKRHAPQEGGISGIFDHKLKFVARSHASDARRGHDPAPELHQRMQLEREGLDRFPSLDDTFVYTSWTFTRNGWAVALATPSEPIVGAFWRYMALLGALFAAMLAAGLAFASLKGRGIASALALLEARTAGLAHGRTWAPVRSVQVAEVDRALHAVDEACAVLAAARAERDRLLEAEQRARATAEQANRAKDEFLAMLGHELRNPLAAVSNAAELLRGGGRCTGAQLEFAAAVITRQVGHLKRLIDDLLDVGRVMTGKILLDSQPLDLQASVRHVVSTLETAGMLARHRVQVETQAAWVSGDPTRVEQIISNLLVNAATYTPAGGELGVRLLSEGPDAVLQVRDTGQGIRAEHLERIFELFFQAQAAGTRANGGLGIGLTLVKRLVELHGGRITAESRGPGHGAVFTVRLPAVAAPSQSAPAPAEPGVAKTVLIVEDNPDERESLRLALELHGHRVLQASDAASALREIARGEPDIALVDIGLPGSDGYALAREIRARFDGAAPVLIALTGYGSDEDARRAREAGFVRHLTKPVQVGELATIVSRTVS